MTEFLDRETPMASSSGDQARTQAQEVQQQQPSAKRARSSREDLCLPCSSPSPPRITAGAAAAAATGAAAPGAARAATTGQSDDEDHIEGSLCYIHSDRLLKAAAKHPQHPMRTLLVHSLIEVCGLLPHLDVVEECQVDRIDLTKFHSRSYVDFLRKPNTREQEEFGCDYDCPCFPQMWDYARAVVGGTLAGARKLIDGEARVAMHFNGGRHHAKPDRADGFCYINDICIAIFELLVLGPVLYIDIDCHHGDGVEQAFYSSNRVREYSTINFRRRK